MATLATPDTRGNDLSRPGVRQGGLFGAGTCRSTSRAARSPAIATACPMPETRGEGIAYLHLGLYAYRRDFLLALDSLPPSRLEAAEKLEQLRVLEAGYPIAVGIVDEPSVGIDTPEDYCRFVARWRAAQSNSGPPQKAP